MSGQAEDNRKTGAQRKWPAIPVYTPHDYPLILKLSEASDLPATWEEWWANFKASEAEQRRRGLFVTRVRVHAGKFKAWLQANSLSSSESTRQQYAQERLDMKRARREARRAAERLPLAARLQFAEAPPPPSSWAHRAIEVLAYVLLAVSIGSALIALKDIRATAIRSRLSIYRNSTIAEFPRPFGGGAPLISKLMLESPVWRNCQATIQPVLAINFKSCVPFIRI
jgi:hypothetical protein